MYMECEATGIIKILVGIGASGEVQSPLRALPIFTYISPFWGRVTPRPMMEGLIEIVPTTNHHKKIIHHRQDSTATDEEASRLQSHLCYRTEAP